MSAPSSRPYRSERTCASSGESSWESISLRQSETSETSTESSGVRCCCGRERYASSSVLVRPLGCPDDGPREVIGASSEPTPFQCCMRTRSWARETSSSPASSSSVGFRPRSSVNASNVRFAFESIRDLPNGSRIVRAWSATARCTVVRIHQVA